MAALLQPSASLHVLAPLPQQQQQQQRPFGTSQPHQQPHHHRHHQLHQRHGQQRRRRQRFDYVEATHNRESDRSTDRSSGSSSDGGIGCRRKAPDAACSQRCGFEGRRAILLALATVPLSAGLTGPPFAFAEEASPTTPPSSPVAEASAAVPAVAPAPALSAPAAPRLPASQVLDVGSWPRVRSDAFAVRVPPGFLDITEQREEEDPESAQSTLTMNNRARKSPFLARFASPDGAEVISVMVRPTTELRLSFFEVKDVSDFGSIQEAAKLFISPGAKLIASREFTAAYSRVPRTYYLYEFTSKGLHVAMSVAVASGLVYVLGAAAPEERWRPAAARLRAAAGAFALV